MKVKNVVIISLFCLFIGFLLHSVLPPCKESPITPLPEMRTDTVIVRDTVYVIIQQPVKEVVTHIVRDTFFVYELKSDTAFVEIPITSKIYADSLYRAYVSGYKPSLDSLMLYPIKEVITNTVYVPKIEYKRHKWSVGVHVGYGTDFQHFSPYIGVGVQYNIFSW